MKNIRYYDIGVNLFSRQFTEPEKILAEAEESGVCCIITGSAMKENRLVNEFVKTHSAYGTAGIHPHNADYADEEAFEEIEQIVSENPDIVAVGECGLDYNRMFSSKENQINCLKSQIKLADDLDMPMFLHERDASEDMVKIFEKYPERCRKAVIHCFTGDRKILEQYVKMGFYIGITGWICDDRRAAELRDAAKWIPPDRILLETDAPYLIPKNVKGIGRINHPKNIVYVLRELVGHMEISEDELERYALENTKRLFL